MEKKLLWEEAYKNEVDKWGLNMDSFLSRYKKVIPVGKVLDIGIGEGRNSIPFALNGYSVKGLDLSETAVERCSDKAKEYNIDLKVYKKDVQEFEIKEEEYSLIIAANVMNFFKKSGARELIDRMKKGVKKGGVIYIAAFSTLEPRYKILKSTHEEVEENTFYNECKNFYFNYFTRDEMLEYFSDFELLGWNEGIMLDFHGEPHYHGVIDIIIKKKRED